MDAYLPVSTVYFFLLMETWRSFDEFVAIISQTTLQNTVPFNYESDFIKLYFGRDKSRQISYR